MEKGVIRIKTKIDNSSVANELNYLKSKLNDLKSSLELSKKDKTLFSKTEIMQMEVEVERLTNKIQKLESTYSTGNLKDLMNDITKKTEKLVGKVAKWGLALLSVRGLYRVLSRASNAYLAANEQLTNKLQVAWIGLGTALSGVIEYLVKMVRKAVVSILYFVSLLTGVNYIAKANAIALKNQSKATKGLTKAVKEANKELAAFDEMNILGKTDSALSGGGFGSVDTTALLSLNEISKEAQKNIEKLAEKMKPIYDWFTDPKNADLIKGIGIAIGSVFGASVVGGWVGNISKLLGFFKGGTAATVAAGGAGSGLLGLLGTLGLLALDVWLIKIAVDGIDDVVKASKQLSDTTSELRDNTKENTKQFKEMTDEYIKNAAAGKTTEQQDKNIIDVLLETIDTNKDLIQEWEKQKNLAGVLSGAWVDAASSQKLLNDESRDSISKLSELYNAGKLNAEQTDRYKKAIIEEINELKKRNTQINNSSQEYKENSKTIKALQEDLKKITGDKYQVILQTEIKEPKTSAFKRVINGLFEGLAAGFKSLGYGIKVPKLAQGGVVNRPTYAQIGEAGPERVIPLSQDAEWLDALASRINGNGGGVTNVYLDGRLIQRQYNQKEDEFNFATNGGV